MDPLLNADLSERAIVRARDAVWQAGASPHMRVLPLDRLGDGRIWSTEIVQIERGASLALGDALAVSDVFVVAGTLCRSSDRATCGPNTYLRLARGDRIQLSAAASATLFVKRYELTLDDPRTLTVFADPKAMPVPGADGLSIMPLYRGSDPVRVSLLQFAAGMRLDLHDHFDGEEFLVLEGELRDEWGTYDVGSWVRQPAGSEHAPSSAGGCLMFSRAGHLE